MYCTTTATIHYGRGIAYAATGQLLQARAEQAALAAAYARIPESRYLFNNTSRDILAIAVAMLDGEIAYREATIRGSVLTLLRHAIALDDALPYDEPWGWMQPTRHAYGALLLEQGHVEEAGRGVRRRPGIGRHLAAAPANTPETSGACTDTTNACAGWARDAEAGIVARHLDAGARRADVPVLASLRLQA